MSLAFSIETLEAKKNILFCVKQELEKETEFPDQVKQELESNQKKMDDLEKAIKILNAASL